MANLADVIVIDPSDDSATAPLPGNSENARKALAEAVAESGRTETQTTASSEKARALEAVLDGEEVPAKFRGKALKDVLDSYANLESRLGSMSNELGTQRALTDRLLDLKRDGDLKRNTPPARPKVEVTASEILDKPAETLDRVLAQREEAITQQVNERLQRIEMSMAEAAFKNRHSDFETVVNDQQFADWLKDDPIRLRAAAAANSGNWQIADELLTSFKRTRTTAARAASATSTDLSAARKATLESSSGGSAPEGNAKKGKTYSRSDLMRLRIEDPETYYGEDFQNEILRAYNEGRVK